MKKINRRNFLKVMGASATVAALSACSQSKPSSSVAASSSTDASSSSASADVVVDKFNKFADRETLEIEWWGYPGYQIGMGADTYSEQLIEKVLNVKINSTNFEREGYITVRPVELASGNIPDFMHLGDPIDVIQAAEQGFIARVPFETIKKYAPTYLEISNRRSVNAWLMANYEDENYGLITPGEVGTAAKIGIWRTDWLKNVGITKLPETIDEMEAAFDAIKNGDPDKKGTKNLYPMSGDFKNWHMCFTQIFGAYGVLPFNWMKDENGEVIFGAFHPNTKVVLAKLADWYKKGYIHPDMITDSSWDSIPDKFKNCQIGYRLHGNTADLDESNENSTISIMRSIDPNAELALKLAPYGPDGERGTFTFGNTGHVMTFGYHLEEDEDKLERLLYLYELLATEPDFAFQLHMGDEGVHWEETPADELAPNATTKLRYIGEYAENPKLFGFSPYLEGESYWCDYAMSVADVEWTYTDFKKEYDQTIGNENLEVGKTDIFLKPDVMPSAGEYFNDLRTMQLVAFAKIVSGEKPVDYYETFLEEWLASGGEVLLSEAKEMGATLESIIARAQA